MDRIPATADLTATVHYEVTPRMTLSVNGGNLLNATRYNVDQFNNYVARLEHQPLPIAGRSVQTSLVYRY